jgi:transposase
MLNRRYETDLTGAAWELVKPLLPAARHGGRRLAGELNYYCLNRSIIAIFG